MALNCLLSSDNVLIISKRMVSSSNLQLLYIIISYLFYMAIICCFIALEHEGLYRLAGVKSHIEGVKAIYDKGNPR